MDKIVLVFKGDYGIENHLNDTTVNLNTALGLGTCDNCTGNAQAVQAYVEAREATNNWALAIEAMERTGHQFSVTGHGLQVPSLIVDHALLKFIFSVVACFPVSLMQAWSRFPDLRPQSLLLSTLAGLVESRSWYDPVLTLN